MGKLIFVLGGARSGKSRFAQSLFDVSKKVAYLATALPSDPEMAARIQMHKKMRPAHWLTVESPVNVAASVRKTAAACEGIIIDCITLFVNNLLLDEDNPANKVGYILGEISGLIEACKSADVDVVVVSNDVGQGIVPDTKLGRDFRDIQGLVNQELAKASDEVHFVIAGLAQRLK